jgi:hypothetical protein
MAEEQFRAVAVETAWGVELDIRGSTGLPAPVLRRVLLRALRAVAGGREIGLEHVEAVLGLLGRPGGGVDLPGSRGELRGGKLALLQQRGASK